MENRLTPAHALRIRTVLRLGFMMLSVFLPACTTMELHRAAAAAGVKGNLKDTSAIVGTFENQSAKQFGPKYMRLWELLRGTEGVWALPVAGGSDYGDEVRIEPAAPGFLEIALLSHGKVWQTASLPYSIHGNHLFLRHKSSFGWLPLGYHWGSSDLAMTGEGGGDLVVLTRYEFQGIVMLIGNAGDCNTSKFRFPRIRRKSD